MTRQIVELMKGKLGWKSERGVGSAFWIDLPTEEGVHLVDEIPDMGKNPKILMEQLMKRLDGIHLIVAHTSELGLELAKVVGPELILMDINLPGMNGYQLLEIFKSDQHLCNVPIIAITANAMPGDIERGKKSGFADYVTKPIHMETFFDAIERCLS